MLLRSGRNSAWLRTGGRALSVQAQQGTVTYAKDGVAHVQGMKGAAPGQLVALGPVNSPNGVVVSLRHDETVVMQLGVPTLDSLTGHPATVVSAGRMSFPVRAALQGRVVSVLGQPLDGGGPVPVASEDMQPISLFTRPPFLHRTEHITRMLYTGVPVLDTLYPCGRGHRYLIVGPRGTGKRSLAQAMVAAQHAPWQRVLGQPPVHCVFVAIAQSRTELQHLVRQLRAQNALERTTIVATTADMAAGTHVVAPSVGCAVARRLRDAGNDVLLVLDDLGAHASALEALEGSARMALPTAAMQQAAVLEQAAQLAPHRGQHPGGTAGGELAPNAGSHSAAGSLTVVALADAASPDQLAKEGQLSMADEAVTLRAPKSLKRPLPAVDLRSVPWRTHAAFQPATLRVLSQRVRRHLVRAVDITSRAKLAAQYGVLDEDGVEDVVEDMGAIERLLFARGPDSSAVSPTQLLLLLHAADSGLAPLVRPGSELEFAGAVLSRLHERFPELLRAWEESFQCSAPLLSQQVLARVWSEMWTVSKAQGSTGVRRPAMPFEWTARRGSR